MTNPFSILAGAYASRSEPEAQHALVRAAWDIALGTAAIVLAAALVLGAVTLSSVFAALDDTTDTPRIPSAPLDKAALSSVLSAVSARAELFRQTTAAPAPIKDPRR